MTLSLNTQHRKTPLTQETSLFSSSNFKRVVDLAIPFIDLHKTAYLYADTTLGASNAFFEIQNAFIAFEQRQWKQYTISCVSLALLVSSIALAFICYNAEVVVSEGSSILKESYFLSCHVIKLDLLGVLSSTFHIGSSGLYILSTLHGTPGLTFLSLIAQGTGELITSYSEYKQGRYLETAANVVLATIRVLDAKAHAASLVTQSRI